MTGRHETLWTRPLATMPHGRQSSDWIVVHLPPKRFEIVHYLLTSRVFGPLLSDIDVVEPALIRNPAAIRHALDDRHERDTNQENRREGRRDDLHSSR